MRVKRFLNAQLLRQIIHSHAPESVVEKCVRAASTIRCRCGSRFRLRGRGGAPVSYREYSYPNVETNPVYLVSIAVNLCFAVFLLAAAKSEITRKPSQINNLITMAGYSGTPLPQSWNQTRPERRHNQRARRLSSITRYNSRRRNVFRSPETGVEFCPPFHQEAQRIGENVIRLARENRGHRNSLGLLAKEIVRRACRRDGRCNSR